MRSATEPTNDTTYYRQTSAEMLRFVPTAAQRVLDLGCADGPSAPLSKIIRARKSEASSSTDKQPNVQARSSIAPSSETRMHGSPSYPTPTSMRSSVTACWSISADAKSARQWRMGEAGSDLGGRVRRRVMHRA
jgi:hypothetical protein